MSYLLFLDESGFDQRESPYQVLAGVAIRDDRLWPLVCAIREEELRCFGRRITAGALELKAKKLLKTKVFRLARQKDHFGEADRRTLAESCLAKGAQGKGCPGSGATADELAALCQAKLAFVEAVLGLLPRFEVKAFASMVPKGAPVPPQGPFLRKDYSYLFERFFYFLQPLKLARERGIVVFDELERSQAHMLVDQMALYFLDTAKGKQRSERIIPEPFFVHSELTSAIQIADLVAYIISWGFRVGEMTAPAREELKPYAEQIRSIEFSRQVPSRGAQGQCWGFTHIKDLRPRTGKR